eukprot:SAG11_NODE_5978_length_1420_cov_1.887207_1_plen_308_part_00
MSGQSWSRREAPWGSRIAYAGGNISDITKAGPGMLKVPKSAPARVTSAQMDVERAALAGMTLAEYRATRGSQHVVPRSTKERDAVDGGLPATGKSMVGDRKRKYDDAQWYYLDLEGKQQGPYKKMELAAWFKAGYLKTDTQVKKGVEGKLRDVEFYSDISGVPRKKRDASEGVKLYVGNCGEQAERDELRATFAKFGSVIDVWIPVDDRTGRGRNFCFVKFELESEALAAIEAMHGERKLRIFTHSHTRQQRHSPGFQLIYYYYYLLLFILFLWVGGCSVWIDRIAVVCAHAASCCRLQRLTGASFE